MFFFFQKPLEQRGIIACAVGNVVHINRFSDQPVHADILSGDHISVSAVSQFFILRDMAGQRKQLQPESVSKIRLVMFLAEFAPTRFK